LEAAVTDTGRLLESLGHTVEASYPAPFKDGHDVSAHFTTVVASWTAFTLDYWSRQTGKPIRPDTVEPSTWRWPKWHLQVVSELRRI
jgi:hypothetical protein